MDTGEVRKHDSDEGSHRQPGRDALDEAQDLCFDAWESASPRERVRLARRALEISPDCADAYIILANEAKGFKRRAELYARGVKAAERAIGDWPFKEEVGHFWGLTWTRPYMRARFGLAQSLWELGRHDDAISHCSEMLRLNPNDNQGVRFTLLRYLLEDGRDSDAAEIMKFYDDEASAGWIYTQLLMTFRNEGDSQDARDLLWSAVKCNYHVPAFLLGKRPLPRVLPDQFSYGYESEAIIYAADNCRLWVKTQGALEWLAKRLKWNE